MNTRDANLRRHIATACIIGTAHLVRCVQMREVVRAVLLKIPVFWGMTLRLCLFGLL